MSRSPGRSPSSVRTRMASGAPPATLSRLAETIRAMTVGAHPGPPIDATMRSRVFGLAYGFACYAVFFVTYLYAIGFIGGFVTPTSLDGPRVGSFWIALAINVGLVLLFGVQHSVMARPWFKSWWTRFVPAHLERATYVLASSLELIAMFVLWRPMGVVVWDIASPGVRFALHGLMMVGFLIVLVSTFLINHFDLFGLRQVWLHFRKREYTHLRFATPGPYRIVRHPLYVGWIISFWATPTMTIAHLVFALLSTAYILAAIRWEERDLMDLHGANYRRYRESVPMLVPVPGRAWESDAAPAPEMA